MTLPASGPITMADVAAELGISAVGLSLNDSRVRALAGIPSGAISFADLHGKSALSVSLSVTSASQASNTAGFTFGTNTRTVHGGDGSETTQWTALDEVGGTWTFPGGDTGASVTPRVDDVIPGGVSTATIRCTVTKGGNSDHEDAPYTYINTSIPP
jgi:hypothetical protein